MMTNIQNLLVAALLSLAIPTAAQVDEVFRLFFRYGFDQGLVHDQYMEPTKGDIEGLLCATNDFLTTQLRDYKEDYSLYVYSHEIDWGFDHWIYNGSEPEAPKNVPVMVNFTISVTSDSGGITPTNSELWEATKWFDYMSYIQDYLWTIDGNNYFRDTRGLWYEPFIVSPVTNTMMDENDQCPAPSIGKPYDHWAVLCECSCFRAYPCTSLNLLRRSRQ